MISIGTRFGLFPDKDRRNNAAAGGSDEIFGYTLSAGRGESEAGEQVAFVMYLYLLLDFFEELNDLQKGPWEVEAPRSSSLGGDA